MAAGSSQTQAAAAALAAMASVALGQADEYSGLSPEAQAVGRVEGVWHTSFEPVVSVSRDMFGFTVTVSSQAIVF